MKKLYICLIILIIFVFSISFFNKTYGKFISEANGDLQFSVAVPLINNSKESITVNVGDMVPGDIKTYDFSITNFNENIINEVSLNYSIAINKSSNIPLEFVLYKNSVENNILTNLVSNNNELTFGTQQTDTYELIINWPSIYKDYSYSNSVDYIDIEIEATQII